MSFIADNQIIVLTAPQVEKLIVDAYKKGHEQAISEMDRQKKG
jgi:hypothetical protein